MLLTDRCIMMQNYFLSFGYRLTAEIKNPVCDDFIEALDQLTNPEHLFKVGC